MFNPMLIEDFYKLSHPRQFPPKTEFVYSNTTPRSSRLDEINEVVVFGLQYLVSEFLVYNWNENFFKKPKEEVISKFKRITDATLGKDSVDMVLFEDLHDLGYLPIKIKSLPEGTLCPIGVPFMTIINTDPKYYWITNYFETLIQTTIWGAITSATIARQYKQLLDKFAEETSNNKDFVQWQGHDFSCRGMRGVESGAVSGAAHLLSFTGTDTVTAIEFLEKYYFADVNKELVGGSVSATEHAVMCAGGDEDEEETFRRLIEDVYPSGIISIVSDTWDYWNVLTNTLPKLKNKIMARDGKIVVRPDTGDPVKIVTGYFVQEVKYSAEEYLDKIKSHSFFNKIWDDESDILYLSKYDAVKTTDGKYFDIHDNELSEEEVKGSIQILYSIFGGTINNKGFIDLDPHIGLIYGDSITYDRARAICERLKRKGFSSTNVVYGIGSYTYCYNTRDTFSIACKATWVQINGKPKDIFKDPKTGDGMKKSAKGLLMVSRVNGKLVLKDQCTPEEEAGGELQVIFENGTQYNQSNLCDIRKRLN